MIFVTVGTHEQSFNRLVQYIDGLNVENNIFIQTGYCTYKPKNCQFEKMISYERMLNYSEIADIIITHGGPGSIMLALQQNKIPIVVPRQHKYGEHVNDHQVDFTRRLETENKIIAIYDIENLEKTIRDYEERSAELKCEGYCNNKSFNKNFKNLVDKLSIKNKT